MIAIGNSSAHIQGKKAAGLGFIVITRACALLVGSKVTSCPVHGEFISHRMEVLSSVVVRSQDFRDE